MYKMFYNILQVRLAVCRCIVTIAVVMNVFFLFRLLLVLFKPKAHYYALVDDHKFSPKTFKNEEKEQKID